MVILGQDIVDVTASSLTIVIDIGDFTFYHLLNIQ
jgi:hypothetical protein